MKLEHKKSLVARTLKVGKGRIVLNKERLAEVKEAITRQDIKDLIENKTVFVKEPKGRKTLKKRKTRRRAGSIKKKVQTRKKDYMAITRKLRAYLKELRKHETISREDYRQLRKEIRTRAFRSKAHLKERIANLHKE